MRLSARNQLRGTVHSLRADGIMAEVVVRLTGGELVVAAITADSAARLGIVAGKPITAIVKSTEVMLAVDDT